MRHTNILFFFFFLFLSFFFFIFFFYSLKCFVQFVGFQYLRIKTISHNLRVLRLGITFSPLLRRLQYNMLTLPWLLPSACIRVLLWEQHCPISLWPVESRLAATAFCFPSCPQQPVTCAANSASAFFVVVSVMCVPSLFHWSVQPLELWS